MNRVLSITLPVLFGLLIVARPAWAQREFSREQAVRHGWQIHYAAGLEEARRTGRPVMLVFRCVT